jgi:hypothetical protein
MHMNSPILKFDDVTIESSPHYETELWNVTFGLNPGELLLVRIERENERPPLADAATGWPEPGKGASNFS